jgi:DNA-directed RNA polymerase specialized sigma24 family protein
MPSESEGSVTHFFGKLRSGDRSAAGELWKRFFPRLVALAGKTLRHGSQAVAGADDAAQSALISFWQRAERGDFADHLDRNSLWKLLAAITVRKSLKQARRERAEKRGGGKVRTESALPATDGAEFNLDHLLGELPAHDFDLRCEELLLQLNEDLRPFALLRLMGHKNREIATLFQCTERKVERKLQLIRQTWQREM